MVAILGEAYLEIFEKGLVNHGKMEVGHRRHHAHLLFQAGTVTGQTDTIISANKDMTAIPISESSASSGEWAIGD